MSEKLMEIASEIVQTPGFPHLLDNSRYRLSSPADYPSANAFSAWVCPKSDRKVPHRLDVASYRSFHDDPQDSRYRRESIVQGIAAIAA